MHCIYSCSSFPAAAAAGPCSTTECDNNCIPHTVGTRINTHTPEEQESLCDTNQTGQKQAKCMQKKKKKTKTQEVVVEEECNRENIALLCRRVLRKENKPHKKSAI
jgi:hypothetical protein